MNNASTISTHKIIILVVFICAAIMTSLFLFHLRQNPERSLLDPEIGLLFPEPRNLKSFELIGENNKAFNQKNFYGHWTLLFFGFTHCASVCPTTLTLMSRAYDNLNATIPTLQVVLVSLDPERDSSTALATYTHSFNNAFMGVTGKLQEVRKLQSQLGIYSAKDQASSSDNYQIQHTSSIMLINPKGQWVGLFKFGLTPVQLTQAIKQSVQQLS